MKRLPTLCTKIDGIIINENFNLEIDLIEISGLNNKVNSKTSARLEIGGSRCKLTRYARQSYQDWALNVPPQFYEDRKKLVKSLKSIYLPGYHAFQGFGGCRQQKRF
ncbi:hypothetical protein V8B55DRAFT_1436161 [Mucor lusitanicus]